MYGSWKFHCRGPSKPGTSSSGTSAAASNGGGVISSHCAPTSNVVAADEVPTAKHCRAKASEQVTDGKRLVRIVIMSPRASEDRQRGKIPRTRPAEREHTGRGQRHPTTPLHS